MGDFVLPTFYHYPPSFTLQPVKATQEKQRKIWQDLILRYCSHYRIFKLSLDEDFPLFTNASINRRASPELRAAVLGDLVTSGQGRWLGPDRRRLLVLWKSPGAWAETLFGWARQSGLEGSVVSFEELVAGDEVRGSPIEGLPRELLRLAIKVLEDAGKAKVFKGGEGDDIGVKFF